MNANELLHWLRGAFEFNDDWTPQKLRVLHDEILRATDVRERVIQVPMSNPVEMTTKDKEFFFGDPNFEPCPEKRQQAKKQFEEENQTKKRSNFQKLKDTQRKQPEKDVEIVEYVKEALARELAKRAAESETGMVLDTNFGNFDSTGL